MKSTRHSSVRFFLFVGVVIFITFAIISVEARKHHNNRHKPHKHLKDKGSNGHKAPDPATNIPGPAPAPLPRYGSYPANSTIFDVLSFGAKGDGVSDDSKALLAAWKAACQVSGATVEIPAEFKFLIKPIILQGPCMPHLVLEIDGILLSPPRVGAWPKSSLFQWINFKWVHDFTIQGTGKVDGQGSEWWSPSEVYYIQKKFKHNPDMKPAALRFYDSHNITVRDIEIVNSPQCHLKFDSSSGIKVDNITINSPEISPNTDGIHLQNTKDGMIVYPYKPAALIFMSITLTAALDMISVGGLGKDKSVACVSDIVVEKISLQNTLSGVRIKTWQGGIGSVKNVTFSNIEVSDVKYPVIIDQFYCDKKTCKNQTEAVAISGVKYDSIKGSYSVQPIHLACSNDAPCTGVDLIDIQLKPSSNGYGGFRQGFVLELLWEITSTPSPFKHRLLLENRKRVS
ncbi:polygalacturonase [Populus alba x Populus x berolinensis]|uniref:Polygalacturonase n=1 Tax=Populus alba x Populus x berolinensis TaxID=444605 RepID=A0AAD6Q6Q1_9ROSI|nr:polygalacturonase [Populus alba x Populus x berolinensis]